MSRSEYCYVALSNGKPVAGFTVKYEMLRWAELNPGVLSFDVYRCRYDPMHPTAVGMGTLAHLLDKDKETKNEQS